VWLIDPLFFPFRGWLDGVAAGVAAAIATGDANDVQAFQRCDDIPDGVLVQAGYFRHRSLSGVALALPVHPANQVAEHSVFGGREPEVVHGSQKEF
jgi:hypothetical protein